MEIIFIWSMEMLDNRFLQVGLSQFLRHSSLLYFLRRHFKSNLDL